MRRIVLLTLALVLIGAVSGIAQTSSAVVNYGLRPLSYTQNNGQWDERVLYRADAGRAIMWFTTDGVYYQFTRNASIDPVALQQDAGKPGAFGEGTDESTETLVLRATLDGANPNPIIHGADVMEHRCNYFLGNDPSKWHTDVPNYRAVVFEEIYAGIDLKYHGRGDGKMEYDFLVSPGADVSAIMVQYDGAKSVSVNESGELVVETGWGDIVEQRPIVYQVEPFGIRLVEGKYVLLGDGKFGFELGESYEPVYAAVIDPVLSYSTYLGGGDNETGYGIAVDGAGAAYVTGNTWSADFPTLNPYQTDQSSYDVFVTKLASSGASLSFSTYLGGSSGEMGYGIAVDGSGAAYVAGFTQSSNFPTMTPYQPNISGPNDAFVTKLSATGNSLEFSTYLGGSEDEECHGIAVDGFGSAYVTGFTYSSDFPTVDPFQTDQGDFDAFVTKFSSSGTTLDYSTYLGGSAGSADDFGWAISVDEFGSAYVTGYTGSTDFPTQNYYQTDQG